MSLNKREQIHHELLEALYKARKQVEYLEAVIAHNATFLGIGVEREVRPAVAFKSEDELPDAVLRYLGLVGREEDISNYIGREGDDASRPRLGHDAPASVRPMTDPRVGHLVGHLALGHPDDALVFDLPGSSPVEASNLEASLHSGDLHTPDKVKIGPGPVASSNIVPENEPRSLDILAADDDEVNRFALRILLNRAGHRCVCVENGMEALEALMLRPFDCLISDMRMLVMDGPELVRRVRAGDRAGIKPGKTVLTLLGFDPESRPALRLLPRNIPIIALTGLSLTEDGKPFTAPGVDMYLNKPLDIHELTALLGRLIPGPAAPGLQ